MQAYDQHLNMILGEVEETVTTLEVDEETYEQIYKVSMCYHDNERKVALFHSCLLAVLVTSMAEMQVVILHGWFSVRQYLLTCPHGLSVSSQHKE